MRIETVRKIKQYIEDGFTMYTYAYGASMLPYINSGDIIKFRKKHTPYEVNDVIVLYDGIRLVAHIVYEIRVDTAGKRIYDVRGVYAQKTFWILEQDIIGYVGAICRNQEIWLNKIIE